MGQDERKRTIVWLTLSLATNVLLSVCLIASVFKMVEQGSVIIKAADLVINVAMKMDESEASMPNPPSAEAYISQVEEMVEGIIPKDCEFVREAVSWIFNNGTQAQKDRICELNNELECNAPECAT